MSQASNYPHDLEHDRYLDWNIVIAPTLLQIPALPSPLSSPYLRAITRRVPVLLPHQYLEGLHR